MIRYQITDGTASRDLQDWLARLNPDVDFIQMRERDLNARKLAEVVRAAIDAVPKPKILVNDRADVALACGAAGVHLRAGSLRPQRIKRLASLIVTVSCHTLEEAEEAQGADYLLVSPVFIPISKPDSRKPLGLEHLSRIALASRVPVIALGGITAKNTEDCLAAGAAGVAGISLFQ